MKHYVRIVFILLIFLACGTEEKINIYLIGDSTMSDKTNPETNPERGWGQMLPHFFNEQVTVKNFAVNGRSTKSFINEKRWETVVEELKTGDYLFIQFGHNDQKIMDSLRYTNPFTAYRQNLIRFINESRAKGAIPVLFTSIVRRAFNSHGVLEDTHGVYPFMVRDVAHESAVPFVDLQLKSEELVLALGAEKSKELYLWLEAGQYEMYPDGKQDNTHFSKKGALEMARLAVEGLQENKLAVTKYLINNPF